MLPTEMLINDGVFYFAAGSNEQRDPLLGTYEIATRERKEVPIPVRAPGERGTSKIAGIVPSETGHGVSLIIRGEQWSAHQFEIKRGN